MNAIPEELTRAHKEDFAKMVKSVLQRSVVEALDKAGAKNADLAGSKTIFLAKFLAHLEMSLLDYIVGFAAPIADMAGAYLDHRNKHQTMAEACLYCIIDKGEREK